MSDVPLLNQITTISAEGARRALAAAVEAAVDQGLALSIAVVDAGGHLVAFQRMDGSPLVSVDASIAKARSAAYLAASTKTFQELIEGGRSALTTLKNITPIRGGVPILVDGSVVGAIGGSGGTGVEDEHAALAGVMVIDGIIS